ncbi:hypothetical protein GGG16DRAFT_90904 [Schizophyllum commune]
MIITEDGPTSPLKTPTTSQGPSSISDDESDSLPPPSYYGSMSDPMLSSGPHPPWSTGSSAPYSTRSSAPYSSGSSAPWSPPPSWQHAHSSSEQLPTHYTPEHPPSSTKPDDYGKRATRRFWRSLGAAVLIWILLSILVDSLIAILRSRSRGSWQDHVVIPGIDLERCSGIEWKTVERPSYPHSPFADIHAALNITSDDYTSSDLHVADYSYEATGSLDLDLTDETLMLLAQGSHQSGRLHVTTHTKSNRRAYAIVIVKYTSAAALAQMHLCKLSSKGVQGFGIHTPDSYPRLNRPEIFLDIKLSLPAGYVSKIAGLQTVLPNYSQYIADLGKGARFQHVALNSTLGPVHAETLVADTLIVGTSNAPITGVFNATKDLGLITSNAPIDVELGLTHADRSSEGTSAVLYSSNGYITARCHLLNPSSSKEPLYSVLATTTNKYVNLFHPTSPLDAILSAHAVTSNGPAQVSVNPAFEGDFMLHTSNSRAVVDESGAEDPTGRERERTVWVDHAKGGRALDSESAGTVTWGDRRKRTGSEVTVVSSNGRVALVV